MSLTGVIIEAGGYLRLTGVYAVWVWFNATLFKFLAIGPKNQVDYQLLRCQDSWWHNLLYINNLFKGPMVGMKASSSLKSY